MRESDSPLQFPCTFPIKALGKTTPDLDILIVEIIRRHVDDLHEGAIKTRPSKGGNYLSVTVTIEAASQEQLNAIYQDLTDCPEVLMAL